MKTLSQLKKDANAQILSAEMIYNSYWQGEELPERLKGIRQITRANSVAIFFKTQDGNESELRIERAINIDYTDDSLIVYGISKRKMTEQETKIIESVYAEIDAKGYYNPYWIAKKMFAELGYDYLGSTGDKATKWRCGEYIYDKNIRGEKEIEYKLYKTA